MFIYIHTSIFTYMYVLHVCNESIRRAAVWAQAMLSLRQLPSPSRRNPPLRRNLPARRKLPSRQQLPSRRNTLSQRVGGSPTRT